MGVLPLGCISANHSRAQKGGDGMRAATLEDVEQIVAARLSAIESRLDGQRAYSVGDVADRLSLSVSRVRELIASGELPSFRVGKSRRVAAGDLAAFIADRRAAPLPPREYMRGAAPELARSWLADFQREAYGDE
jgi:excisionase family DNA binding protein